MSLYAVSNLQVHAYFQESSEKDALLLQMFYHLKSDEEVDEGFEDEPEPGNLKKKLRCLVRNCMNLIV